MTRNCKVCDAELGPHEEPRCVTCRARQPLGNYDAIVAVLEHADKPLAPWDIRREAEVRLGQPIWMDYASSDERLCWGGRQIWGLYRHGLLPGIRTVSKAAAIYIHAAGQIETKQLHFVMRRVGYRINPNTLTSSLSYEPWVIRSGWQNFPRSSRSVRSQIVAELGLARRLTLTDVLDRANAQVETELAVYNERLAQ